MNWIKVKVELPQDGQEVIMLNANHETKPFIYVGYYCKKEKRFFKTYEMFESLYNATHWFPIPSGPIEIDK